MTNTQITPYTIHIDQAELDDLQRRLAATRFPAPAPGDSWDYGTPVSYLQRMVEAWRQFDWRAQEARMNAVPNFRHRDRRADDPLRARPLRRGDGRRRCCSCTPIPARSPSSST